LDVVKSGEDMARCVPGYNDGSGPARRDGRKTVEMVPKEDSEENSGCGSANGRSSGCEMAEMERRLQETEAAEGREVEVTSISTPLNGQRHDRDRNKAHDVRDELGSKLEKGNTISSGERGRMAKKSKKQQIGQCQRCGYMSSQAICKACMLLEGLNRSRPKMEVVIGIEEHGQEAREGLESRIGGLILAEGAG